MVNRNRRLYTPAEVAELLGVGRSTVYELIGRGELPGTRVGRRVFVTSATLEMLLGERPPPPAELARQRA